MIRRRVLFVDDERLLVAAVADVLSDHHDVEVAATVAQAIRRVRDPDGAALDVVLCDVTLPDGTALDVLAAWPGAPRRFVLISGAAGDPAIEALAARGHVFVSKPFDVDDLAAVVDRVARDG